VDDDLPAAIGRPATGALHEAGVTRLSQLPPYRERDLLAMHGVGPKAVRLLRAALAERGLRLADD
jgi:hypothetical protein